MIALLLACAAFAGIALEQPAAVDAETVIQVTDALEQARAGETVRVVHRPGLAGEREVAVGITDGRGRVRWTPREDGIAEVRAGDEVLRVRIPPAEPPLETLVLLALLLLTGAAATVVGLAPRGPRKPGARAAAAR